MIAPPVRRRIAARRSRGKPGPVFQDLSGGVVARSAGDSPTGMGAGSAEAQALDRRLVAGPTRERTADEGLVQRHLPGSDVAVAQAEPLFKVAPRQADR